MDGINVLSLFDGMSCGRIALGRAGIKVNKYYASEIDKYAIQVTQHNYPDTIQLGSVTDVNVEELEPIDLLIGGSPCQSFSFAGKRNGMTTSCNEEIYTLERYLELKSDGFQFEGESYLFWEYMRILTDIKKYNPDVLFLLENVEMGAKWERVLSEAIGIYGVHINSALVSAQNRKRIYWTNIRVREEGLFGELYSDIPQPEDRGILLRDILDEEVDEKYYLSEKLISFFVNNTKKMKEKGNGFAFKPTNGNKKANSGTTKCGSRMDDDFICVAQRGRESGQNLEPNLTGKTNCFTSVQKDNLVMQLNPSKESGGVQPYQHNRYYDINGISPCLNTGKSPAILIPEATSKGYVEIKPGECFDAENINSKTRRGRKMTDKSNCLMAKTSDFMRYEGIDFRKNYAVIGDGEEYFEPHKNDGESNCVVAGNMRGGKWENTYESSRRVYDPKGKAPTITTIAGGNQRPKTILNTRIRRLTPIECERLQTVPDNYTNIVSDTQRYKMLGNGWTIDVIAHIFNYLK